jgi:K+-transporting ATPase ATPase C chain
MSTILRLVLVTLVGCVVVYPALLLAFAQTVVPERAQGSLLRDETGEIIGSELVAQGFEQPAYLWPRPSAASYDAAAASGSNLSGSNPALRERAEATLAQLGTPADTRVPADLVAASGSGLDPHVTLAGAELQAARIAAARRLDEARVLEVLRREATDASSLRPAIVNVLEANLALDRELGRAAPQPGAVAATKL